jgi:hypothetical protein
MDLMSLKYMLRNGYSGKFCYISGHTHKKDCENMVGVLERSLCTFCSFFCNSKICAKKKNPVCSRVFIAALFYFSFWQCVVWTQGLELTRQALYMNHTSSPFSS